MTSSIYYVSFSHQAWEWRTKLHYIENNWKSIKSARSTNGLTSSIKSQAKLFAKSIDGKAFASLVTNSENLSEKFFKAYDQKVDKYSGLVNSIDQFLTLERESGQLLGSYQDVTADNHRLQRQLQDITQDLIKFRQEGTVSDCSKMVKKDLLADLEQKQKTLTEIRKLHVINEEKVKASIDTKKKLIAEYKADQLKLQTKIKALRMEVDRKNQLFSLEDDPFKILQTKYATETSIL